MFFGRFNDDHIIDFREILYTISFGFHILYPSKNQKNIYSGIENELNLAI